MFKRLVCIFLSAVSLVAVGYLNRTPVFGEFASELEVYIGAPDSTAQIIIVDADKVPKTNEVCGEAFTTNKQNFDLNNFLSKFSAKLLFAESIEGGTSYYAYSSKIKYNQTVNGKKVNLQVFIGENSVKVGSPIICGSF